MNMERLQIGTTRRRDKRPRWLDGAPVSRCCGSTAMARCCFTPFQFAVTLFFLLLLVLGLIQIPKLWRRFPPDGPSVCLFNVHYSCGSCIPDKPPPPPPPPKDDTDRSPPPPEPWTFDYREDHENYGLSNEQCDIAFPGLFTEIEESVRSRRPGNNITIDELEWNGRPEGSLRAMVYGGKLYIIDASRVAKPEFYSRALATLYSLDRALVAYPDAKSLPNAEFMLSVNDEVEPNHLLWTLSRKARDRFWLYPDFGYYSWPNSFIGSYPETTARMLEVERNISSFDEKIQKLVWRGKVAASPTLRNDLLAEASDKSWADVMPLDARKQKSLQPITLSMEDQCKYMFIAHTEGKSFSGQLKYIQNCQSVIFAHKMQWIQPFHYLLVNNGKKQNYVEVERDFSNLEEKMDYYLEHLDEAERIATNSMNTFRERYLTEAAQACYWRKLIKGWRSVSFEPDFYKNSTDKKGVVWRGTPFESWALKQALEWKFK